MSNNTNDLFLAASRVQLRFATTSGHLSVEDLWALSLKNLDVLAVATAGRLTQSATTFLENPDTSKNSTRAEDQLRLEILKVVIGIKQEENRAAREKSQKASQVTFLKDLLRQKETAALESLSAEEIRKQLAELEA